HEVLAAVAKGSHVISYSQAGHTNTEREYLPILADKLRAELRTELAPEVHVGDIEVLVSEADRHPLAVVS
ncbi:hypothetical protein C8F01DRAFT_989006, partial [Mycena amicta]